MPQKKKVLKKVEKVVQQTKSSKNQPLLKNSINIKIDLEEDKKKSKRKHKKKVEGPLPEAMQTLSKREPPRKLRSGWMPSNDNTLNTINNNIVDLAMNKIKGLTGPPQLPQLPAPPQQPQILQLQQPLQLPQPTTQQSISLPIVSLPPTTTGTPTITSTPMTPAGKPPPPPAPTSIAAALSAAATGAAGGIKTAVDEVVDKIINKTAADKEIMSTTRGRNKVFEKHFNELVDPIYKNNPIKIAEAFDTYKKRKGL